MRTCIKGSYSTLRCKGSREIGRGTLDAGAFLLLFGRLCRGLTLGGRSSCQPPMQRRL